MTGFTSSPLIMKERAARISLPMVRRDMRPSVPNSLTLILWNEAASEAW